MTGYHIKPGYLERTEPEYFHDVGMEQVWQPDVYPLAADLGRRLGAVRIVDLGCGSAEKLVPLAEHVTIVGVDFGPNVERCRLAFPQHLWVEHDLEGKRPLALPGGGRSVVVCADVIEHLRRPERLLACIRDLLREDAAACLLSTPERDLQHGAAHAGPPPNPCHVREWNRSELEAFLRSESLTPLIGLTRSHDASAGRTTTLALLPAPAFARRAARWWRSAVERRHWLTRRASS
jgi:SAM-dependent methyltransferase